MMSPTQTPTQSAVEALTDAIFTAAAATTEIAQRESVASDEQDGDIQWLGAAFESISFFLVLALRIADTRGIAQAQALAHAVGDLVLPRIASTFFSRNPPDAQTAMISTFQENHYEAERDYEPCKTVLPKGDIDDPEAMASGLAGRLSPDIGVDGAVSSRQGIRLEIVATVAASLEALKFDKLVFAACDALVGAAASSEAAGSEQLCPCGSGAPFRACHGDEA